ncbi:MAG: MoaD/ThiS family protein [Euryarchaeota archaeon]|nr:MoaD/ThiS family protein [Euryarchaeota archaeon]
MQVECRFYGPFRGDVGEKQITYETDAETFGELLSELSTTYPELDGRLIENEEIAHSTVVTKGKKDIRHLDGPATRLDDGDVIRLTPSVYGG